jgi:hypothetical protein
LKNELGKIKKLEGYSNFAGYEVNFNSRSQFNWLIEQAERVNLGKNEIKLEELKSAFEKRYNKTFTDKEIISHCLSIIHNGVFKKGWSLNGEKMIDKE